jgi:HSP20 family protein
MRYRHVRSHYAARLASVQLWEISRLTIPIADAYWRPDVDVFDGRGALVVTLELAGVDPDAIDVLLFDDALVVEGRRDVPTGDDGGVYRLARIRQGPFRIELPLPEPIDPESVTAHHQHGLLRITLQKAPA